MPPNEWLDYFTTEGYKGALPLGSGMEGVVYNLGNNAVGKVWTRRSAHELTHLRAFYDDLAVATLPFGTPQIYEIRSHQGVAVTIERMLIGTPLRTAVSETDNALRPQAVNAIVEILRGLGSVQGTERMRQLAVLDESRSLWDGCKAWSDALLSLMIRKINESSPLLRAAVPNFDTLFQQIADKVTALRPSRLTAIHGDLCPDNILIEGTMRPIAVLDFGFLSTVGDPAFDASIAAGIYNMYGPHAAKLDKDFMTLLARELEYSYDLLLLYRAVYAIVTCTAYDPLGKDGHFEWCANNLRRRDIAAILQ